MTYCPDLAEESMVDAGPHIRTIGWLDDKHEFATGNASAKFVNKLRKLTEACYESIDALGWGVFMGVHTCELCHNFMAPANVGIPTEDLLYVAPEMISHYVEQHNYLPPQEFANAVSDSPIPGTRQYRTAVAHFRELHNTYRERQIQSMYDHAACVAIENGGDDAAIMKAADAYCGYTDDETLARVAVAVAEFLPQRDNAK